MADMDVSATGFGEVGRCSLGKLSDALDREDFAGNLRENGGGIAGTGPISSNFSPPRRASASIMNATI
jgi:hypothetical protein